MFDYLAYGLNLTLAVCFPKTYADRYLHQFTGEQLEVIKQQKELEKLIMKSKQLQQTFEKKIEMMANEHRKELERKLNNQMRERVSLIAERLDNTFKEKTSELEIGMQDKINAAKIQMTQQVEEAVEEQVSERVADYVKVGLEHLDKVMKQRTLTFLLKTQQAKKFLFSDKADKIDVSIHSGGFDSYLVAGVIKELAQQLGCQRVSIFENIQTTNIPEVPKTYSYIIYAYYEYSVDASPYRGIPGDLRDVAFDKCVPRTFTLPIVLEHALCKEDLPDIIQALLDEVGEMKISDRELLQAIRHLNHRASEEAYGTAYGSVTQDAFHSAIHKLQEVQAQWKAREHVPILSAEHIQAMEQQGDCCAILLSGGL